MLQRRCCGHTLLTYGPHPVRESPRSRVCRSTRAGSRWLVVTSRRTLRWIRTELSKSFAFDESLPGVPGCGGSLARQQQSRRSASGTGRSQDTPLATAGDAHLEPSEAKPREHPPVKSALWAWQTARAHSPSLPALRCPDSLEPSHALPGELRRTGVVGRCFRLYQPVNWVRVCHLGTLGETSSDVGPLDILRMMMIHGQTHGLCSLGNLTSKGRKTPLPWQEPPVCSELLAAGVCLRILTAPSQMLSPDIWALATITTFPNV